MLIPNIPDRSSLIPSMSEWRCVSKKEAARITVTDNQFLDTSNAVTDAIASLFPGYTDDNEKAYKSLFASIHNEHQAEAGKVQTWLEGNLNKGETLTSKMVGDALKMVEALKLAADNAINVNDDFCLLWNDSATKLSPRGDIGKQFIREFDLLVSNKYESAGAFKNVDKLAVLNKLKYEFKNDGAAKPELASRLKSLIELEIQLFLFAANVEKLKNCPQLSSMINAAKDCWRLVLDGQHQHNGIHHFENEKGYMQGMLRGLNLMISTLDTPLSADLYRELHDTAIDKVYVMDDLQKTLTKGYFGTGVEFNLVMGRNCTEAGLLEYRGKLGVTILENNTKLSINYSPNTSVIWDGEKSVVKINKSIQEVCADAASDVINNYHFELATANKINDGIEKETAILTSIAKCCQDLDQHHFFNDGNIRTAVFLVMNKLLLQNGLAPVILHEPNAVDMFSLKEIVGLMREGQKNFRQYQSKN